MADGHSYWVDPRRPLSEKERDSAARLLADPLSFPQDFTQWLQNLLQNQAQQQDSLITIPGTGVVQINESIPSLKAYLQSIGVTAYYKFKEASYDATTGAHADAVADESDWTYGPVNLAVQNDTSGGTNDFVGVGKTTHSELPVDDGAADFLTIPTAKTAAGDYEGASFGLPSTTSNERLKYAYTGNKITYMCWVRPYLTVVGGYEGQVVGAWADYAPSMRGFGLVYDADADSLKAKIHPTGGSLVEISKAIVHNEWYHCAITLDNGTMKFYVNGLLIGSASYSSSGITTIVSYNNLRVGLGFFGVGIGDYDGYFYGSVDELAFFAGAALTQTEIQNAIIASLTDPETGLYASLLNPALISPGSEHQILRIDSSQEAVWGKLTRQFASKSAAYTAVAQEDDILLVDASGAARTITLPAAASSSGMILTVKKTDSSKNGVTIDGNASETIDGATTQVLYAQYESMTIVCDGTGWQIVAWDIPPTFCSVLHDANQTISTATPTILAFNTETYDNHDIHSSGANTKITVQRPGLWQYHANVEWDGAAAGKRTLEILLNGTAIEYDTSDAPGSNIFSQAFRGHKVLAVGDYLEVRVTQDSGSDLDVLTDTRTPQLSAIFQQPIR